MKIRTAFGLVALAAGLIGVSAANAATCVDEFTGAVRIADVVGTDANDRFGPDKPYPFTLYDNAVVAAGGGNDIVDVQGLARLTICLEAGDDQVINGSLAKTDQFNGLGFSVRGGGGNDTVSGTWFPDAVNGRGGFDSFVDPALGDGDVCRNFESLTRCEFVNILPQEGPE